ncbi:MAG: bifunctional proline dehydrogenase/L-glutamate gamma-semialdehyde dehydrogenase PutA, partial [Alphaproteobacteria bacterium]|nr:bifunctional proline dehydrogenase/L-glutamate gamma-semialdehyde dehydrogenase PutA [Alphaproteobacteria bacterium]
ISSARLSSDEAAACQFLARRLVRELRESDRPSGIDAFMREYALSSDEGVALMCLAEALLRVPDPETADRLIRDKIGGARWDAHRSRSDSMFVNASTWALMLTGRLVQFNAGTAGDFEGVLKRLVARTGEPFVRQAIAYAMRMLGRQFVLGRTIEEALKEARPQIEAGYLFSFDMLGEAAYTRADATRYADAYRQAIAAISASFSDDRESIIARPSISVKLSALHPRYEWLQRARVMEELIPVLARLGTEARAGRIGLTIDAEEADRLDLMLDLFETLAAMREFAGWNGLGLAVQAYQKRALPVVAWLADLATRQTRTIPVRLVKGAYWDTEIKRAQEGGLADYPVFTRKAGTDVSYIATARAILAYPQVLAGQFATHNAHTIAAIDSIAPQNARLEFQRLHGMGEELHALYRRTRPGRAATRIYAPVGSHEDLLAYLVRRLLENGANTSFVNRLSDEKAPIDDIIADPVRELELGPRRNPRIPLPADIFPGRRNSAGFLWSDPAASAPVLAKLRADRSGNASACPVIGGRELTGAVRPIVNPADLGERVGTVTEATPADARAALDSAAHAQIRWDRLRGDARAQILERAAEIFEREHVALMGLAAREAGKTLPNALAEVREAVDFLRFYALEARKRFQDPVALPGPTGEKNLLELHGRGVFACISPWNFPLSIFAGQVAAALAAGNAVLAKPAEQSPLIAAAAVGMLHEAGVPREVLQFLPGDGPAIGAALFGDVRLSGVAFTGSGEAALTINRALAGRAGPIASLVAETGGQNAMIVDSTALPEQVARDVVSSAFDSAGQRCSALRVLFLQEDVAERMLEIVLGAMDELRVGDPLDLATDIGPVIDAEARDGLVRHAEHMRRAGRLLRALPLPDACARGIFFPPHAFEISSLGVLAGEVFGPVLHVVRFAGDRLGEVCDEINATGFGLTLGVHSRIAATAEFVRERVRTGNIYVNRNQIGAVVGQQPFGGEGLSGTGPKAGGPNYLLRFALERTYTVNTAAVGGNAALLSGE